jgi:membrane protease YdiL (CAAX protease family)
MTKLFARIEQYPFPSFLLIAFSISWVLWYVAGTFSPLLPESSILGFRWAVSQISVFAPAFAGWIILSLTDQVSSAWKWNTVWVFFLPLFVLAWVLSVFTYEDLYRNPSLIVATVVAAIVMVYVFSPSNRRFRHIFPSGSQECTGVTWIALSVLLFPAITLAANVLAHHPEGGEPLVALGGTWGEIVKRIIALFTVDLLYGGSLGEEPGWRGFALPYLQKKHGPLEASIILGFVWALWHAPIDVSHGYVLPGFGGVIARLIWTIPVTILFTFFYNRTRASLLVAILLHTSVNFGIDLLGLAPSAMGLFFGIVLILAGCAVCVDRMWQRLPTSVECASDPVGRA